MAQLYGVLGNYDPTYLLASGEGKRIAISLEPGNGLVKRGTLMYRKANSVLYAPAAAANVIATNYVVVLGEDVDTDESATVAASAMAYSAGEFLTGYVTHGDGSAISAAEEVVLRAMGILFKPLDNPISAAQEADNSATVSVTVQNDGHGTGSASPASGTYGTEVTLTATPSSNYHFKEWQVISGDVIIEEDTFTIGHKAVTVKAIFEAD